MPSSPGWKKARHPDDRRVIRLCGLTEENAVRVEWEDDAGTGCN